VTDLILHVNMFYDYIYTTLCNLRVCINSDTSLDVVLWGERATSFPAEQLQKAGQ
jgi:hypothetical protein